MLRQSIESVPPGRWGIGVSGGADSVALLRLMLNRADIQLHVVHLDHETRDGESGVDAAFVAGLSTKLQLPCTIERRSNIERTFDQTLKNIPSRFRQARFALFRRVIEAEKLQGILLAHHADDQAETVLMRVLRGAHAEDLQGMRFDSSVRGMQILRPLLEIPAAVLKQLLQKNGQAWREDASNQCDKYQRNRVRQSLARQPDLLRSLLELKSASANVRTWLQTAAPLLGESFAVTELNNLPAPVAKHSAACWLIKRGVPPTLVSEKVCVQLMEMASDAASSPGQHFPGQLLVRRKQHVISTGP